MCIYGICLTFFFDKNPYLYSDNIHWIIKNKDYIESLKQPKPEPEPENGIWSTGYLYEATSLYECKKQINKHIRELKNGYACLYLLKLPPYDTGGICGTFDHYVSKYDVYKGRIKKNLTDFDLLKEPMSNIEKCKTYIEFRPDYEQPKYTKDEDIYENKEKDKTIPTPINVPKKAEKILNRPSYASVVSK